MPEDQRSKDTHTHTFPGGALAPLDPSKHVPLEGRMPPEGVRGGGESPPGKVWVWVYWGPLKRRKGLKRTAQTLGDTSANVSEPLCSHGRDEHWKAGTGRRAYLCRR